MHHKKIVFILLMAAIVIKSANAMQAGDVIYDWGSEQIGFRHARWLACQLEDYSTASDRAVNLARPVLFFLPSAIAAYYAIPAICTRCASAAAPALAAIADAQHRAPLRADRIFEYARQGAPIVTTLGAALGLLFPKQAAVSQLSRLYNTALGYNLHALMQLVPNPEHPLPVEPFLFNQNLTDLLNLLHERAGDDALSRCYCSCLLSGAASDADKFLHLQRAAQRVHSILLYRTSFQEINRNLRHCSPGFLVNAIPDAAGQRNELYEQPLALIAITNFDQFMVADEPRMQQMRAKLFGILEEQRTVLANYNARAAVKQRARVVFVGLTHTPRPANHDLSIRLGQYFMFELVCTDAHDQPMVFNSPLHDVAAEHNELQQIQPGDPMPVGAPSPLIVNLFGQIRTQAQQNGAAVHAHNEGHIIPLTNAILSGPAGIGKSLWSRYIAAGLREPMWHLSAGSMAANPHAGAMVNQLFARAQQAWDGNPDHPVLVLLSDLELVAFRETPEHRRTANQQAAYDAIMAALHHRTPNTVFIATSTIDPQQLDPNLMAQGQFTHIEIGYPDVDTRRQLFNHYLREDERHFVGDAHDAKQYDTAYLAEHSTNRTPQEIQTIVNLALRNRQLRQEPLMLYHFEEAGLEHRIQNPAAGPEPIALPPQPIAMVAGIALFDEPNPEAAAQAIEDAYHPTHTDTTATTSPTMPPPPTMTTDSWITACPQPPRTPPPSTTAETTTAFSLSDFVNFFSNSAGALAVVSGRASLHSDITKTVLTQTTTHVVVKKCSRQFAQLNELNAAFQETRSPVASRPVAKTILILSGLDDILVPIEEIPDSLKEAAYALRTQLIMTHYNNPNISVLIETTLTFEQIDRSIMGPLRCTIFAQVTRASPLTVYEIMWKILKRGE